MSRDTESICPVPEVRDLGPIEVALFSGLDLTVRGIGRVAEFVRTAREGIRDQFDQLEAANGRSVGPTAGLDKRPSADDSQQIQ